MNFNSQICTTREQSERLLSLGLKKETADMVLLKEMVYDEENHCTRDGENYLIRPIDYLEGEEHRGHIPTWSLHRLLSILPRYVRKEYEVYGRKYIIALDLIIDEDLCIGYKEGIDEPCDDKVFYAKDIYSSLCDCIEWLIKEGYFPKEYLEE